jgi:FliI/YscN family ATPase
MFIAPLGTTAGLQVGDLVTPLGHGVEVPVGAMLRGRILDGLGRPIDGGPPLDTLPRRPVEAQVPNALTRPMIHTPFVTGVRAIDGLTPLGIGQRLGIMAGSGVGKSVLLGMLARHAEADVNVIALLGERGREVREFLDRDLGAEGLAKSVVIVATSDAPASVKAAGLLTATAIAEAFRDEGKHVLLMVDSLTRVAMAWREIGLAMHEPPTQKGYPPSVFSLMPAVLERAGCTTDGAITGLYTVLVDGDDFMEPIADASRSILDGHLELSRRLAQEQLFPAIDPLRSISRVADAVATPAWRQAARVLLRMEATLVEKEDFLAIGDYQPGSLPWLDAGVQLREVWRQFRMQRPEEASTLDDTLHTMTALAHQVAIQVGAPELVT